MSDNITKPEATEVRRDPSIPHYTTDDPNLDNTNGSMSKNTDNQQSSSDRSDENQLSETSTNTTDRQKSGQDYGSGINTTLTYGKGKDGSPQVDTISFSDADGQTITAQRVEGDDDSFSYTSKLHGDEENVESNNSSTLAEVILHAYVHLGVLQPTNFKVTEDSDQN